MRIFIGDSIAFSHIQILNSESIDFRRIFGLVLRTKLKVLHLSDVFYSCSPSRNESMVVLLEPHPPVTIKDTAATLLGKEIFVGWPHLSEGKVISVMDESTVISANGIQFDKKVFNLKSKTVVEQ